MKRVLMTVVLAAVLMATSAHAANQNLYFSGNLGYGILTDANSGGVSVSFDPGVAIIAAVGSDLGEMRVEGEMSYRSYDVDSVSIPGLGVYRANGDVSFLSIMGNAYYDFEIRSPVTPYVGIGLGLTEWDGGSDSGTEIAYQIMLGVAYDITPKAALTTGYRYWGFTDSDGSETHELNVGVRIMFQ